MSHPIDGAAFDRVALLTALGGWARGDGPVYLRLAAALRRAVRLGDLPAGVKLPPERSLAAALNVSRGTVMAAYGALRLEGILESRQGSGSWVRLEAARPLSTINDPAPGDRSRRLSARLFEPHDGVIDLVIGALPDTAIIRDYLESADWSELEKLGDGHGYQPLGMPALRERIADYFARDGVPTSVENVAVTGGAQQAISTITDLLLRPGDTVVVESPTYPGALDAFRRAGARIVSIPTDGATVGITALREAVVATAARMVYLVPACHNPCGHVMPEARRRAIAAFADEHEVCIVEDNILAELTFDGRRIPPIAAFARGGRVLSLGSVSKISWGGLRVGWVRGDADVIDRLGRLKAAADFGVSALSQFVACHVLDDLDQVAATQRQRIEARLDVVLDELPRQLPDWAWTRPAGGLSLWIRLPVGNADDFLQVALRHGVDVLPGSAHGVDDANDSYLRLSYTQPEPVLREGVRRLAAAWAEYVDSLTRRAG